MVREIKFISKRNYSSDYREYNIDPDSISADDLTEIKDKRKIIYMDEMTWTIVAIPDPYIIGVMPVRYPRKKFDIWIGNHHMGQGYDPPSKPQKLGQVIAPNFKQACAYYEAQRHYESLKGIIETDRYLGDQDCRNFYDFDKNTNSWTGPYFETEEEAWKTFSKATT